MPLESQLIDVLFQGGLREDIDPKVLPPGSVLKAENVIYDRAGALRKRGGTTALNADTSDGGFISAPEALLSLGKQKLAVVEYDNRHHVYSYSDIEAKWMRQDTVSNAVCTRAPFASETSYIYHAHVIPLSGKQVHVWTMGRDTSQASGGYGLLMYRVVDEVTGTVLIPETQVSSFADISLVRVVAFSDGSTPVIVSGDANAGAIKIYKYNSGADSWSESTLKSSMSTAALLFDACPLPTGGAFFTATCTDSSATGIELKQITTSTLSTTTQTVTTNDVGAIGVCSDTGEVAGSWVDSVGGESFGLKVRAYSHSTLVASWATLSFAGFGSNEEDSFGIASGYDGNGAIWVVLYDSRHSFVHKATTAGADFYSENGYRTMAWSVPVSRPFVYDSKSYIAFTTYAGDDGVSTSGTASSSAGTAALYCLDSDSYDEDEAFFGGEMIATIASNDSYSVTYTGLPHLVAAYQDSTRYYLPFLKLSGDGLFRLHADLAVIQFSNRLSSTSEYYANQALEVNGTTLITGGITQSFDGANTVESGFIHGPEIESISEVTGSYTAGQVIGIAAFYEWYDVAGNVHRSAPTVTSYTFVGSSKKPSISFRMIHATRRRYARTLNFGGNNVRIVVYATAANSSGPYVYVGSSDGTTWLFNQPGITVNPTGYALTNDSTPSALRGNLPFDVPGNPGVLAPDMPPGSRAICQWKNRVFIASSEDPKEIWYTRAIIKGEAPAFSRYLTLRLDDSPDGITGLAPLGDKLAIFTKSRIYYLVGDGPNDNGTGSPFVGPILVTADIGCSDPRSVAAYTGGALFDCGDGIRLLDMGLQIQDVGGAVKDTTELYPLAVSTKADLREQRIYCMRCQPDADCRVLVFDYRMNAWTVLGFQSNQGSSMAKYPDGMMFGGPFEPPNYVYCQTIEDAANTTFTDGSGREITATLSTPWIHLAGLGGFQRVRRAIVTGQALIASTPFALYVYYDYGSNSDDPVTFTVGSGVFRVSYHLQKQRCSAVRFEIVDSTASKGASFNGLTLEVGVKRGVAKLPLASKG